MKLPSSLHRSPGLRCLSSPGEGWTLNRSRSVACRLDLEARKGRGSWPGFRTGVDRGESEGGTARSGWTSLAGEHVRPSGLGYTRTPLLGLKARGPRTPSTTTPVRPPFDGTGDAPWPLYQGLRKRGFMLS
jgi:hypothetical protein